MRDAAARNSDQVGLCVDNLALMVMSEASWCLLRRSPTRTSNYRTGSPIDTAAMLRTCVAELHKLNPNPIRWFTGALVEFGDEIE